MSRVKIFRKLIRNREQVNIGDNVNIKYTKGLGFVIQEGQKRYYDIPLSIREATIFTYLLSNWREW